MTTIEFLRMWSWLPSREGKRMFASNSEKMRWIKNGSVEIDGRKAEAESEIFDDMSVVLHPKSKHRTTLQ